MRALLLAVAILATSAHAAEPPRFDARATLQRAQVGTYSPRAAPPVRVEVKPVRRRAPSTRFAERLVCRPDTARPEITICEHPTQ